MFQNGNTNQCLGRPNANTNGGKVTMRNCDVNDWSVRWWTATQDLNVPTFIGYFDPSGYEPLVPRLIFLLLSYPVLGCGIFNACVHALTHFIFLT
jgi:hypothetical protein